MVRAGATHGVGGGRGEDVQIAEEVSEEEGQEEASSWAAGRGSSVRDVAAPSAAPEHACVTLVTPASPAVFAETTPVRPGPQDLFEHPGALSRVRAGPGGEWE